MSKLKVFSGCTEFGSEVQAFKDRGHDVTTLGIEGEVDILMDIRDFSTNKHYDFMSFHPPCTEFSKANWRSGPCKNRTPDMSIVNACFRIVQEAKPTYWMIENPVGCLRYFIGKPNYTLKYGDYGHYCQKPTDLWGVLPMFDFVLKNNVVKGVHNNTAFSKGPNNKQRSIVPYGLSMALCLSMERELL